jgi:hypothetical protein
LIYDPFYVDKLYGFVHLNLEGFLKL